LGVREGVPFLGVREGVPFLGVREVVPFLGVPFLGVREVVPLAWCPRGHPLRIREKRTWAYSSEQPLLSLLQYIFR
jgi:hypothetical protein